MLRNWAKERMRPWIPPKIADLRARSKSLRLDDRVETWEAAVSGSVGYQDPRIIRQVKVASSRVSLGQADFERDGVTFSGDQVNWPIAGGLLLGAARHKGTLRVLDFGGSLGSQFFQCRRLLAHVPHVEWTVVEQKSLVELGKEALSLPSLRFLEADAESVPWNANTALFSSVLQYLNDPFEPLQKVIDAGADIIIVDRTPMSQGPRNVPAVQYGAMSFGTASYPAWILSEATFEGILEERYAAVARFSCQPGPMRTERGLALDWRGGVFVRK